MSTIICSKYSYVHGHKGRHFTIPSATVADISYDIKQLIAEHSIGALPSLASLQEWFDEDEEMTGAGDFRADDRAEALRKYLDANSIRREVFEKLKSMHDFKRRQEIEELGRYRRVYGAAPPDEDSTLSSSNHS